MRRPSHSHLRRAASCASLCAVVAIAALAFAGVGGAAPAPPADLSIAKSDSPDPVNVGTVLTYTIQVRNLGAGAATGVTFTDQLPKGVDFLAATTTAGHCVRKGKKVSCALGTLDPPTIDYSGPPLVTLTVIPRQVGTISNTASVKGAQKDPVAANNRATTATLVVGPPATCRGVPVTIAGTAGNDTLVGTGGRDVIASFAGDDTVVALAGRDLICAGAGNDYAGAGSAADRVFGAAGRDRLLGRGGPDRLKGGAGNDVLKGNRGSDRLRGGSGRDRCRGGAGMDSIRGCER
ncbi:MAG: hypothetical protein WA862_04975 [Solirubrobacterales bacterium]